MKKNKKIPTYMGMVILILGLVAGILLINSQQIFKIGADVTSAPENVRVSNITASSFTVSWTTKKESEGFVKWGKLQGILNKVALDSAGKGYVHSVNITGADAAEEIAFTINSNADDYDNEKIPWKTQTLGENPATLQTFNVTGTVVLDEGSSPPVSLVYVIADGITLSTTTSSGGSFILPLSNYIDVSNQKNPLEISVNTGSQGSSQAVIYPLSAKTIPTMVIGRTYDFRSLTQEEIANLPESSITVPEALEISSRFEVSAEDENLETKTVTLDSVDDGEIITTTDPEFFGVAPKGEEIEITVESEAQTDTVTAGTNGKWSWSPPNNLEEGEHTITIKWRDETGILRTITRTFVVAAAEGPAFISTPSATPETTETPRLTATPTTTASSTPRLTATPTETQEPIPDSGSLTPTIGLFIMGMGILMSSLLVWRKA